MNEHAGRPSAPLDAAEARERGRQFQQRILEIKKSNPNPGFPWYRYDSLGNLVHLDRLLDGEYRDFRLYLERGKVVDIGSADGELAYFLESLGAQAEAVDNPPTNHNQMWGIRFLRRELGSQLPIHEVDLDGQFKLPGQDYGTAFLLGVLYHLKNPYYVLERLAQAADWCFLSTLVGRTTPRGLRFHDEPMAYILAEDELNQDNSNFWVFSEAGVVKLAERCGWHVARRFSAFADPGKETDERLFCLMRSRRRGFDAALLKGWWGVEQTGWRWTWREFAFEVPAPGRWLVRMFVPDQVFERLGAITLESRIGTEPGPRLVLPRSGEHVFEVDLSRSRGNVVVECRLDKCLPRERDDERELGLVVAGIRYRPSP